MDPRTTGRALQIAGPGHVVFAVTLIGLGILGLVRRNFTPVWQPVPKGLPAREAFVYFCAGVSLVSGVGLLVPRTSGFAARLLFASLLLWLTLFRLPNLFLAPTVEDSWSGSGETAVMVAAAWVLYVWAASAWDRRRLPFACGKLGLLIARRLYGLALIPFGVAHFVYIPQTASLVPNWLPAHVAWAYFTGGTFVAAGLAVLSGVGARLAATLSAWQIGLFTVLVWLPIVGAGSRDPFVWSETILSCALTAGAWVVADSYRGLPWLFSEQPVEPA